jgi:hypothetical protein
MVTPAQWHRELIADFKAQGSGLREAQMMRIRRLTSADKTWLRSNKSQMDFVTETFGFGNG